MKNRILGLLIIFSGLFFASADTGYGMMCEGGMYGMMGYGMNIFGGLIYFLLVINLIFLAIFLYDKIWKKK